MNNKYKILLVEDDDNIRIMVTAMLESAGYQVIEGRSCAAAITLASSHLPDLILLDLGLPDRDGMEVKLTQTEYIILAYLSQYGGKVLTYAMITRAIWGDADTGSVKRLQVNMANIRRKLGIVPGGNSCIVNELGVGYRMQSAE